MLLSILLVSLPIMISANSWLFGGFVIKTAKRVEKYHQTLPFLPSRKGWELSWDGMMIGHVDPDVYLDQQPIQTVIKAANQGVGVMLDPDQIYHTVLSRLSCLQQSVENQTPIKVNGINKPFDIEWLIDSLMNRSEYQNRRNRINSFLFKEEECPEVTATLSLAQKWHTIGQCQQATNWNSQQVSHWYLRDSRSRWNMLYDELKLLNESYGNATDILSSATEIVYHINEWYRTLSDWKNGAGYGIRHGTLTCRNSSQPVETDEETNCFSLLDRQVFGANQGPTCKNDHRPLQLELETDEGISCFSQDQLMQIDPNQTTKAMASISKWWTEFGLASPQRIPLIIKIGEGKTMRATLVNGVIGEKWNKHTNTIEPFIGWYLEVNNVIKVY